jgi:DeoR/GlpR family transcriptional regulator of sugar metabolism
MVSRCRQVIGVVDARKWGKVAAVTFAKLPEIDTIITDMDASPELVEQVQRQVNVLLV